MDREVNAEPNYYKGPVKPSIFGNIFSKIEKAVNTFSILKKIFSKNDLLLCALRAHISKILIIIWSFVS